MASSAEVRDSFLNYFVKHNHLLQPSASLVPDDTTLLFTNAGMVPFKKCFIGQQNPPAGKVTSSQKCLRAGGKHNDLDNVGRTSRHHTLFEMLGNFSFGDYFKEQAIQYAWDFLTKECQLDPNRLLVTYHYSDLETKNIWQQQHAIPDDRIIACSDKDNFWSMGSTGPCGPCTEIFYDHGPNVPGGPPGSPYEDGDRFVEVWNLVFMQFNQTKNGERENLPKPCVDTGSGLERLSAVMQGVYDNYQTDQFKLLQKIIQDNQEHALSELTQRVVSDHVRALACLLEDGVMPSNEGRGYILRRLLRRAACFMYRDGQQRPILAKIMAQACQETNTLAVMQQTNLEHSVAEVDKEEVQFSSVIAHGSKIMQDLIDTGASNISGEQAFKLYDTHGLPIDLMQDLADANKLTIDLAGFNACMAEQKARSRSATSFDKSNMSSKEITTSSEFIGYQNVKSAAKLLQIFDASWNSVENIENAQAHLVLDKSVFYAESGGQVADTGEIVTEHAKFNVTDVQKYQDAIVISGENVGKLTVGDQVFTAYDVPKRHAIMQNHSATHLLHAALQKVLGPHVTQKGSLVESGGLRFDFSHNAALTKAELQAIEQMVIEQIRLNLSVSTHVTSFDQAKALGAKALFEDKYGDKVRMLSMGEFSIELCGGTHVAQTSEIGMFAIINETGIAAGIRRIEAVTGRAADSYLVAQQNKLQHVAELVGANNTNQISDKIAAMHKQNQSAKEQLSELTKAYLQQKTQQCQDLSEVISLEPIVDASILGAMADELLKRVEFVVLLSKFSDKHLVIVASKTERVHAGDLLKHLVNKFQGKGGGKPQYARGQISEKITQAELLQAVTEYRQTHNAD